MSEYEKPDRKPTVEDVRQLMGASTPHFALQIRNRIRRLIADLPPDHPARTLGEREIVRLRFLHDLTQAEIAAQIGVSQMHVSRLLRSALDAMGEVMDDPALLAS